MRRGTRMIVFMASMALTLGSLFAFVGPRHCGRGMHHYARFALNDFHGCNSAPGADSSESK